MLCWVQGNGFLVPHCLTAVLLLGSEMALFVSPFTTRFKDKSAIRALSAKCCFLLSASERGISLKLRALQIPDCLSCGNNLIYESVIMIMKQSAFLHSYFVPQIPYLSGMSTYQRNAHTHTPRR